MANFCLQSLLFLKVSKRFGICFKKLKIDDTATSGQVRKHHAIKEIKGRNRNTSSSIQFRAGGGPVKPMRLDPTLGL